MASCGRKLFRPHVWQEWALWELSLSQGQQETGVDFSQLEQLEQLSLEQLSLEQVRKPSLSF